MTPLFPFCPWRQRTGRRDDVGHAVVNQVWRPVADLERFLIEKAQAVLIGEGALLERFIVDAITAADHGLVIDPVGESHPRSEIFGVNVLRAFAAVPTQSGSKVGIGARNVSSTRIRERGIDIRKAVEGFRGRNVEVITQPVVEREVRSDPERVLGVDGIILVADSAESAIVQQTLMNESE